MGCDGDGVWAPCKGKDAAEESLTSSTFDTHSHVACVSSALTVSGVEGHESTGSKADESLTYADEAKKTEQLLSGEVDVDDAEERQNNDVDVLAAFRENLNCSNRIQLPERPVTAKVSQSVAAVTAENVPFRRNQEHSENAFRTKRQKTNAATTRSYVTVPYYHFGPIPAENDPVRNQGVLVGETWENRVECRKWGVHFPHVSRIAGQSIIGAQSVAFSGGYENDEDHGEWFLFTGSGAYNKDQKFEKLNEALRVSCKLGYPVRVVRLHGDPRSAYAPEEGLRYDGIYRIEKCWQQLGIQGSFKLCRYLFVRCDNEPAPWTSDDEHGDRPRPLPTIKELKMATNLYERKESASWDFDEGEGRWRWMKPPQVSQCFGS